MAVKRELDFDARLLLHIQRDQVNEAKSMLNGDLAKTYNGSYTLLHYASLWNNERIVEHLLELGAEIDSLDKDGKTPLMLAVERGHRRIVKTLSTANANLELVNDRGVSALQMAFDEEYRDDVILHLLFVRLQRETDNVDELVDKLMTVGCTLHQAVYFGDVQVIRIMLEQRGVDVNSRDHWNGTALQIATRMKEATLMKLLLDHGAQVNASDEFGLSPLLTASCSRNKETMRILLEAGANPNVKTIHQGYTPLFLIFNYMEYTAADEETDECVELLLQHGAIPENPRQLLDIASRNDDARKKIFMLINYLAMLKELGRPIAKSDLHVEQQQLHSDILVLFDSCRKFLKVVIFKRLSLLELLTDSDIKMKTYVRNGNLMFEMRQLLTNDANEKLFPYYCSTLAKRISKARRAIELEEATSIGVVSRMMNGNL